MISGMLHIHPTVKGSINKRPEISGGVNPKKQMSGLVRYSNGRFPQPYSGEYEFTPSPNEQVVETKSKSLSENIVIKPIPSNYGLITWDGSVLTVS